MNSNNKHHLHLSQQEVYYDQISDFDSPHYNVGGYIKLKGELNMPALIKAIRSMPEVFDAFNFTIDYSREEPLATYSEDPVEIDIEVLDYSDREDPEKELLDWMQSRFNVTFDIENNQYFEHYIAKVSETEHWWYMRCHHLLTDGYGFTVVSNYGARKYSSIVNPDPENPVTFERYSYQIEAQKSVEYLESSSFEKDKKYWNEKFEIVPDLLLKKQKNAKNSKNGDCLSIEISNELRTKFNEIATETGTNIQQLTLAALSIYFGKTENQEEMVFGVPIHNRRNKKQRNMVGMFTGVIPFKGSFQKETIVADLIQGVKRQQRIDYRYQSYPISYLTRDLKLHTQGRTQLFDVVVNYAMLNFTLPMEGIEASTEHLNSSVDNTYPLEFWWCDYGNDQPLELKINYQNAFFTKEELTLLANRILFMIGQFKEKLNDEIQDIKVVTPEERDIMLGATPAPNGNWFNKGLVNLGNNQPINLRFEQITDLCKEQIAVIHGEEKWTFDALNQLANQIGHSLQQNGIKKGDYVGVFMERSPLLIASLMGIFKSGAIYVPLDTQNPIDRIEKMMATSKMQAVIGSDLEINQLENNIPENILLVNQANAALIEKMNEKGSRVIDIDAIKQGSVDNLSNQNDMDSWAYVLFTSGTTGEPKGAITRHNGAMNHLLAEYEEMELADGFRFLQSAGIGSDISMWQMIGPLLKGGTAVIIDKYQLLDFDVLIDMMTTERVNVIELVPSFIWSFVEHIKTQGKTPEFKHLDWLMLSGEEAPVKLINEWKALYPQVRVLNAYGPCEASDDVVQYEVPSTLSDDILRMPIGRPIMNMNVFVINGSNELMPIGVAGEIAVSGIGVGAGYLGMAEKTEATFVQNPFEGTLGDVMYKTGDLGRWLPDGNVEFLGRIDRQVKVRGNRIELGEIEFLIRQGKGVKAAHIAVHKNEINNEFIIAFIVAKEEMFRGIGTEKESIEQVKQQMEHDLRLHSQSTLPSYMQPSFYCFVDEFPVNLSDKVDQNKLIRIFSEMDFEDFNTLECVAPTNIMEQELVGIWQRLLEIDRVGIHNNFFELGGHSLLATRMVTMIRKELNLELSIKDVFTKPTISMLATFLAEEGQTSILAPLVPQERPEKLPLSFAQERLWFIDRLDGSTQYHQGAILKFKGNLDRTILEESFRAIVNRHEVLRTIFKDEDGQPYQVVMPKDQWHLDYEENADAAHPETLNQILEAEVALPFDLSEDHMLRVKLLKVSNDQHLLIFVMHHIASDGWSLPILVNDLVNIYFCTKEKVKNTLPELTVQYADYAIWQKEALSGEKLDEMLGYWEEKLSGVETLDLLTDYSRPLEQSTKGNTLNFLLDKSLNESLNDLAKQEGVTMFMLLLAAFKVLMHKYSGQEDIAVGSPVANRTQAEVEPLIGFFVNTLVIRDVLSPQASFSDFLSNVKSNTLEAYNYSAVPFEKIVDRVIRGRDLSRSPLFQVLFALQNNEVLPPINLGEATLEVEPYSPATAQFDLSFDLTETDAGLELSIEYCTDLFAASTIERMRNHFEELLKSIVVNPKENIDKLSMLSESERDLILGKVPTAEGEWFNQGIVDLKNNQPINVSFEKIALTYPDAIGIVHNENRWTYQQINDFANQIAYSLKSNGIQKGEVVGVYLDRGFDWISAFFGIMKCGAVYVPLDTQNPVGRIQKMIEGCQLTSIITTSDSVLGLNDVSVANVLLMDECSEANQELLTQKGINWKNRKTIETLETTNLENENSMDDWAYILYTSGTTGDPKGAITRHIGAMNHLLAEYDEMDLVDGFRFLQSAGIGSDISVWQMLAPLLKGGTAVVIDKFDLLDFDHVTQLIIDEQIEFLEFVPSYAKSLIDYINKMPDVSNLNVIKWVMLAGEILPVSVFNQWRATFPDARIWNAYGPCEASDDVTQIELIDLPTERLQRLPIGRPISNMNICILDANGALCPIGIPGELCISGIGVGAGYYRMEEKTAASFVENPFPELLGDTIYKTGDLGRWLPDGNLDFLSRVDRQVKIRGNRVELGEVESFVRSQDKVSTAHLLVHKENPEGEALVAFIVMEEAPNLSEEQQTIAKDELKEILYKQCQEGLPGFMRPAYFCFIDCMPLNLSDKVDEKSLRKHFSNLELNLAQTKDFQACETDMEKAIHAIWAEILGKETISAIDDFFEIGGHSLLAMRVKAAIQKELQLNIPVKVLFEYSSIADLSTYLQVLKNQTVMEDDDDDGDDFDVIEL